MLKNHTKTAIFLFAAAFLFFSSIAVMATEPYNNYGLDNTMNMTDNQGNALAGAKPSDALKAENPEVTVGRLIGVVLAFVGVIYLVLVVYAGLRWMMAQGDEGTIDKAKQTIIAATFGLIIVLAAYAITAFIGKQLTAGK